MIEGAESERTGVSKQIEEVKSNVALVKTGLEEKIDQLAVSPILIYNVLYIIYIFIL